MFYNQLPNYEPLGRQPNAMEIAIKAREHEKKLALLNAQYKAMETPKNKDEKRGFFASILSILGLL